MMSGNMRSVMIARPADDGVMSVMVHARGRLPDHRQNGDDDEYRGYVQAPFHQPKSVLGPI